MRYCSDGAARTGHPTARAGHSDARADDSDARADHPQAQADHSEARAGHPYARGGHPQARVDHSEARVDHLEARVHHSEARVEKGSRLIFDMRRGPLSFLMHARWNIASADGSIMHTPLSVLLRNDPLSFPDFSGMTPLISFEREHAGADRGGGILVW